MQITIDIPEELADILADKWGNLSQRTLEALAIEGYRRGVMTRGQVKQLLNLASFYEVEQFLKERGADLHNDLVYLRGSNSSSVANLAA